MKTAYSLLALCALAGCTHTPRPKSMPAPSPRPRPSEIRAELARGSNGVIVIRTKRS